MSDPTPGMYADSPYAAGKPRGRDRFRRVRPLFDLAVALLAALPRGVSVGLLNATRNVPGFLGLGIRYVCVKRLAAACGDNVAVYPGVFLFNVEKLRLGSNIKVGEMCFVGASGGITIGDDTSLAHGTTVLSEEHDYRAAGPLRETALIFTPVVIGRGVWVGAGVRVTAGVTIGDGAVVGAGSVVTRDVPADAVAVGVPARVMRYRFDDATPAGA